MGGGFFMMGCMMAEASVKSSRLQALLVSANAMCYINEVNSYEKIMDFLRRKFYPFLSPFADAYARVRIQAGGLDRIQHCAVKNKSGISVAIPHYRNPGLAHVALLHLLRDSRIAEIVVVDDGSPDDEFDQLCRRLGPFRPRIRLARFAQNAGILATKVQAVGLCQQEWVLLLDCDNTALPNYLKAFMKLECKNPSTIYASPYPFPCLDFRGSLPQPELGWEEMTRFSKSPDEWVGALWNDGNYFVHRETFTRVLKPWITASVSASDVLFANYIWLSEGNRIHFLPQTRYIHRIHDRSSWRAKRQTSRETAGWMRERLQEGRKISDDPSIELPTTAWKDRKVMWVWGSPEKEGHCG
jgi:hypothetical protein